MQYPPISEKRIMILELEIGTMKVKKIMMMFHLQMYIKHHRVPMVMSVISPIKDTNSRFKGVITFDVNSKKLSEMSKNIRIGQDGYLIVTDNKGHNNS